MSHQNLNLYTVLLLARASKDPRLQGRGRLLNPCTKQNVRMRRLRTYQRWKQLQADHPHNKQKFYGLSHYAPTPSITSIHQIGLGIAHTFSTLILNSFKKWIHSQTSPAFDHYDFLLPRDQIIGLLLDNSLDVEIFT
jgi:hypothetical protein